MAPRNDETELGEETDAKAPGVPIALDITDVDATAIKLKWKAPEKDGGSPITFFILEYKARTEEEWTEGPKVKPAKNPSGCVDGLTTGVKYEFRARAQNKAGISDASEPTIPVLAKPQKAPPKICRKTLTDKSIKVNQQLDFTIPVEGEPAPECKWTFNGAEISSGENVKVSYATNVAKVLLIPARRANEGKYTLTAKNKWGEDTLEVEVKVFGKPTICQGPLKVSEVTKKSCRLEWKPPVDNGGSQIEHFEVEKLEEISDSWLPAGNPKGSSWELKNLVEGRNYKFLVRAVNENGDGPDLITEDFITAKNQFQVPTRPGKPKASNWGPNWAELTWKEPEDDGGAPVDEYKVEMRDVDKRAWNDIARCKDTTFTAEKCGIEAGHQYVFRVTAYNAGGESETSETSDSIEAMERFIKPKLDKEFLGKERDLVAAQLLRLDAIVEAEPAAKISWFLPNGEPLLHNGDSINIDNTTKNKSTLMYKDVKRADSGMLKIIAKNSQGEDEHEIRMTIQAPPARPTGPIEVSKVTPNGCHLMWMKPKDDGGSPVTGYIIEKKDVEKDYWSPCGKVQGKMINVLREIEFEVTDLAEYFVYVFRVMAVNALGESDPLMTPMPTIAKYELDPPNQPHNINIVDFDKNWVKLDWTIATGPRADKFVVEKCETFFIPKDEEEVEMTVNEDGEEVQVQKPGVPTQEVAVGKKSQEYVEYNSGWMVAGTTEDGNMPEIKIEGLQEGYKYQFRVKAVNKAGPSYPSEFTDEIVAKVRKLKPTIDRSAMPKQVCKPKGDTLTLKVKVKGEPVTEKAWFWGRREIKPCGTVVIDNSDYESKVSVFNLERADTGTFTFRAENTHGVAECSTEINVMVPPGKPKGPMKIEDVHAEGCTMAWSPPDDDGGSPLVNYVIERVQGPAENWVLAGRIPAAHTEYKLTGLTQDKEYRVRVTAVNSEGESEPLTCVDSFITDNPFTTPGAPGKPELRDWDSDYFDMKYTLPRNNGGSRILGYELEARLLKEPNWFKAGEVKVDMDHGHVEGIELGSTYAVRVRAKNAAGFGPWSIESDQVVCKHKNLAPKVKILEEKEFIVKEGETVTLFAEVTAEPAPGPDDTKWFMGNEEILSDPSSGVIIDNSKEYKSKLQFDAVYLKDSGLLSCESFNMNGKSKASVKMNVIGKPSGPQDRLVVSSISSSACKLSWGAAKNPGGLPIEYLVEKFVTGTDNWTKQTVTTATQLEVKDLEEGKEYEFRVITVNQLGESEALQTPRPIIAKNQYTVSLPPSQPEVTEWNERAMTIKWNHPIDDGGMPVTGYVLEARVVGSDWQVWDVLDTPCNSTTVQKLQKGNEYQFRLLAVNKAGKSDPGHPSRPKLAKETDLIPCIDAKGLRDVVVEVNERLKFDLPISGEPAPEAVWMKGDVPVSELEDSSIVVTTTETHSKIVFNSAKKKHEGNYQLLIRNRTGEDSAKVHVSVLDVPAAVEAPVKLSQEGTSVTLLWKKVKDDGGSPIEHYQLEKMDGERKSWGACGHTKDNTFTIPGLLSGLSYKFRICAVNAIGDSSPLTTEEVTITDAEDARVRGL